VTDVLFCTDAFIDRYGDDVRAAAPDLDIVVLTGDEPISEADLERITLAFFSSDAWPERAPGFFRVALDAPNLRWLHTMSAGVDSPVFGMFTGRGVQVTTSSGASAEPIAATAMMYLLALSRGLPDLFRAQAAHEWRPQRFRELAGLPIAVVGYGPIGEHVARLAAALGMHPTIVRRRAVGDEAYPVRPLADIMSIVADVDAVVVALPLVEETHGLISADVIANMRRDALFVNVGRGELVDQSALTAALRDGHLGGAGLDVFTPEPLPAEDPLWDLPNVIVTPHNSGTSDGTAHRAALIFLDNLARTTAGETLRNLVG
jgi:phosphoglycerate dehydrogenase-like enzyme